MFTAPEGAAFRVSGVKTMHVPHSYCITEKHVAVASDQFGGILNTDAIKAAEAQGAHCGIRGCRLPYDRHETVKVLQVVVQQNHALNDIPGLNDWLMSIKPLLRQEAIDGITFPTESQMTEESTNG